MVPEKKPIDSLEETGVLNETDTPSDENKSESSIDFDENSTILTMENGMQSKNDNKVKPLYVRRFYTVIALALVVVIFIVGTVVINLLPEKEDDTTTTSQTIFVKQTSSLNIEKIVINGSYGKMVFNSTKTEATGSDAVASAVWSLEGYDADLIASSSVNAAADNLATIYATRIMETDQSQKDLYGFNKPLLTAEVFMRKGKGENYTLTIGDSAPDGSGYYAIITGDNNIYLVATATVNSFNKKPEELADSIIVDTPTIEDISKKTDKKYFDEETGSLATYESIEISGTKYTKKAVFTPIKDNEFVECNVDLGSYSRYGAPDTVNELFGILTNGLVAMDTYVLKPTAADVKKYRLENPEAIVTVKCGSIVVKVKASMYDKENNLYAVMVDGRNAIYAVSGDALSMLNYSLEDFYYQFVFQEFIYTFKNMKVEIGNKTYDFDIKHDTSNDSFTATSNGKQIDDALLATYYQYFLVLSPEVKSSYTDGETVLKATFTYKSTSKGQKVIELVKQSARRYLMKIDGVSYGIVSSLDFDPLVIYADHVMTNQGIPEP